MERHVEAEHLGSRKIYSELEFGGLLHRQVAWPLAFENSRSVDASAAIAIGNAGAVLHQTTGRRKSGIIEKGRDRRAQRRRGVWTARAEKERRGPDDEPTRPDFDQGCKRRIDVALGARLQNMDLQSECA